MIVKLEQKEFLLQLWHFWIPLEILDFVIQTIWKDYFGNFFPSFSQQNLIGISTKRNRHTKDPTFAALLNMLQQQK
jgi:hypothetical protein